MIQKNNVERIKKLINNIKKVREEKKVNQSELANALGISQQSISLYEKGSREPKLETWQKLAEYFNVSTCYLIGFE